MLFKKKRHNLILVPTILPNFRHVNKPQEEKFISLTNAQPYLSIDVRDVVKIS